MRSDFVAMILTHGRPDRVVTYRQLRRQGYTGPIYLVLDDEDRTAPAYRKTYGDDAVLTFSKTEIAKRYDQADNFTDRRTIFYARNAAFELARELGFRYLVQLDDDYNSFLYRVPGRKDPDATVAGYHGWMIRNLDRVFEALVRFLEETPAATIAMAQGGDHFGGASANNSARLLRKAMNSFVLDVERVFPFLGRVNEDVNSYVLHGSRGLLFLTYCPLQLNQAQTQATPGGMSEMYLDAGTYVKSYYTVLHAPSCTRIAPMGRTDRRLHHSIDWTRAVPKILPETLRRLESSTDARSQS